MLLLAALWMSVVSEEPALLTVNGSQVASEAL
jgi:hypothetical protein